MSFDPIAIVGRAVLLPGAHSPEALWEAVRAGRDLVTDAPEGRWGIDDADILAGPNDDTTDRAWCKRGGYVTGFDAMFDPNGFAVAPKALAGLDPVYLWTLHTARQALRDAGLANADATNIGAVFGNLGFPTQGMAELAEQHWLGQTITRDAKERFMSSGPAALLEDALALGSGSYCIDAACASSLYAIKLACDQLHDGGADVMLAGAVQAADDLFIHVGFTALSALSRTGQTRPFHAGADGLLPAEGAGFVVLKRLSDARRDGDTIHGVIRGVGLSNDGRGKGILAPSDTGQARAIAQAYEVSGVSPHEVTLLECHATGTPVGDATELRSSATVFGDHPGLPIGSLKSNTGHLITTAGVAGLIKVLEAMRHQERPPSLHCEELNPALQGTPFRVLSSLETWPVVGDGPRVAGVSAFGFGGNNAHVVVSEDHPSIEPNGSASPASDRLAVIGVSAQLGDHTPPQAVADALTRGEHDAIATTVSLPFQGLKFPPKDLEQSLPQQLALLQCARDACAEVDGQLDGRTVGVFAGMEPDVYVARYGTRWRLAANKQIPPSALASARDGILPALTAAAVVGTMPNIPANRISSQLDTHGPAFTISHGPHSAGTAFRLAARALRSREIDLAIVGAVDFGADSDHRALASRAGRPEGQDGALVFVLTREADADADGRRVLQTFEGEQLPTQASDDTGCHVATWGPSLRALLPALSAAPEPAVRQGPSLQIPAHAPAVTRPRSSPSAAAPQHTDPPASTRAPMTQPTPHASPVQTMAPAPSLPSAMGAATRPPLAKVAQPARNPAAAPAVAMPTPAAVATPAYGAPAPPVFGGVQAAIEAQLNELAVLQQAHMAQQSQLHAMYLATQTQAVHTLLGAQQPVTPHAPHDFAQPAARHALPPESFAPPEAPPLVAPPVVASPEVAPPVVASAPALTTTAHSAVPSAPARSDAPTPLAATPAPTAAAPTAAAPTETAPAKSSFVPAEELPGLKLSREQLLVHSGGKISEIYGPEFAPQDGYERQVRMPLGPLLLCDRVVGLDAEPLSMKNGTIWTETDVSWDAWYLNHDRMPAGIMIESGQADLMLISYLGVDMFNQSDRVYRLLGCELTYHGDLPRAGETLRYDIHLDGHAKHGDVRLMFFHYDCVVGDRPQLSVRGGQAGFFTDKELDDSAGCLWTPEEQELVENPQLDPPAVDYVATELNDAQVKLLAAGDVAGAMGDAYGFARAHVRTPTIQSGDMQLFDRVTEIDPTGGPWGRGYLRAEMSLSADRWFYDGHFLNDPCMPGTLMFEGCLQTMATYLIAMGFSLKCDGWRFQPKPEMPFQLSCRGQAIPSCELLTYEVFVEEVVAGPVPTLYADLLCTVDGLKAFHARRVALELVPDWPLESRQDLVESIVDPVPVAEADGFKFGYASMLACAWGKPSDAFGPMYAPFDSPMRVARLPGPPYHFMTRVTALEGPIGVMEPGAKVTIEYDIPADAWYYDQNGCASMPFAVLLEAALQPCGWLASYVGSALTVDSELGFRNLDGTGTLHAELPPNAGTLVTHVEMTNVSAMAGMIIESFTVACHVGDTLIYSLDTVFGFFPPAALANQAGLPIPDEQREMQSRASDFHVDLTTQPSLYWNPARPLLAEPMLLMIDRVTGYWPGAGEAGIAQLRAEKSVDQAEWFFKAHFFQDPVQPGSLGIEALIQLLQFYMLEAGMDEGFKNPRFEPLGLDVEMSWKYRGQVLLHNTMIESTVDVTETGRDERGAFAIADASLWVDGKRIYETTKLGMRIVEADDIKPNPRDPNGPKLDPKTLGFQGRTNIPPSALTPGALRGETSAPGPHGHEAPTPAVDLSRTEATGASLDPEETTNPVPAVGVVPERPVEPSNPRQSGRPIQTTTVSTVAAAETRDGDAPSESIQLMSLDPSRDRWVTDHCPTYTQPALPMMHVVDLLSQAAGLRFYGLRDVRIHGWIVVSNEVSFDAERDGDAVRLYATTDGTRREVATAKVIRTKAERPKALSSITGAAETLPYDSGALFHGPSFQLLEMLVVGDEGASSAIQAVSEIPYGRLNPGLLDASTHGIPHDGLHRWFDEIGEDKVAYPAFVSEVRVFGPTPTKGTVRCEVRTAGTLGSADYPMFRIQLIVGTDVWCEIRLVESVFPKGPLGSAAPTARQRFLRDLTFEPDVRLSRVEEGADGPTTVLDDGDVRGSNWFPGTIEALYGTEDTTRIAKQEHLAAAHHVHPRWMPAALPLTNIELHAERDGGMVTVFGDPSGALDITPVRAFWTQWFDREPWPVEDLYYGLIERFVDRVVLEQPEAFSTLKGRSVLYVANHETGVESLMFSMIASALNGVPTVTLAKAEHRHTWLGRLIKHCFSYPGVRDPNVMTFFEREDKESLMGIIGDLAKEMATTGRSVMVHVEGTRAFDATHRVQKMSGAFIDMALKVGAPIVPVRFTGGLPLEPVETRVEFPFGLAKQSIWFGAPLMPEELSKHHYGARKQLVINAINNLGGGVVMPATGGDAELVAAAAAWQAEHDVDNEHAVLRTVLAERENVTEDTARVLAAKRSWTLDNGTPEGVWLAELGKRLSGV